MLALITGNPGVVEGFEERDRWIDSNVKGEYTALSLSSRKGRAEPAPVIMDPAQKVIRLEAK